MPKETQKQIKTVGGVTIFLNCILSCKYPRKGTTNILKSRNGVVEYIGKGKAGPYVTINMGVDGQRNLSLSRIIDPVIS